MNKTLVQVLGAVAYGELKAYEKATSLAARAADEASRRRFRKVAAEELRHYKGFIRRLEALGADPERAMRPYRVPLDRYHSHDDSDAVAAGVFDYLGEGIADDLLHWLRKVVDADTASFIDTVLEDEVEHEAAAAAELRSLLGNAPDGKRRAALASQRMVLHMLWSGRDRPLPFGAFLRLGRSTDLLAALAGGHLRRMKAIGLGPLGLPVPVT
jgi:DNA-binding ferritin-like protein (Dps family)